MDGIEKYEDILHLPHHRSTVHPHMSVRDRAAQFSAFAALKGYEEELGETARVTHARRVLDEDRMRAINDVLLLLKRSPAKPRVKITYFAEDGGKAGGAYVKAQGVPKRLDEQRRRLIFEDFEVAFDDIAEIEILGAEK